MSWEAGTVLELLAVVLEALAGEEVACRGAEMAGTPGPALAALAEAEAPQAMVDMVGAAVPKGG